jgi:hypothetical protein
MSDCSIADMQLDCSRGRDMHIDMDITLNISMDVHSSRCLAKSDTDIFLTVEPLKKGRNSYVGSLQ